MSGNNGTSYQKYDGASGTYQEIENSSDIDNNGSGGGVKRGGMVRKLLAFGAVVAVALGAYYTVTNNKHKSKANIDKTISESTSITVKGNGRLKLFDNLSK